MSNKYKCIKSFKSSSTNESYRAGQLITNDKISELPYQEQENFVFDEPDDDEDDDDEWNNQREW